MGIKLPWFRRQMRLGNMSQTTAASSAKRGMAASVTDVPYQGVFKLWTFEEQVISRSSSQPSQRPPQSSRSSIQPIQRQQSTPSSSTVQQLQQSSGPSSSTAQQLPQPQQSTSQQGPTESRENPRQSKEITRKSLKKSPKDKERQSKSRSLPAPDSTNTSMEPRPLSSNNVKNTQEPKEETPPPEYTEIPPPVKAKSRSIFSSKKSKKAPAPTRRNPNAPDFTPIKITEPLNQQSNQKHNKTEEQKRGSNTVSNEAINKQINLATPATSPESSKIVDKSKQNVKSSSKQKNLKPSVSSRGAVNRQVNVPAVTKRSEAVKKTKQNFKFVSIKKPSTETSQQATTNGPVTQSPKPTKKTPSKLKNKESDVKKRNAPVKAPASKAQEDFEETGILSFRADDSLQIQSTSSFLHGGVQDSDECDA